MNIKLNSKKLQILFFCMFLASISFSQSVKKIHGYVSDSKTGLPLVGANILIEKTGNGTSTNLEGYFEFINLIADTYTVSFSYIGYQKKTIDNVIVKKDYSTDLSIQLDPLAYKLNPILVNSGSAEKESSGSISILSREDIDKKQSQTIGEILEEIPGVEIQSTGAIGSSQKISIRGSQSNQVLILLDGIPLNNQSNGEADLSTIPVNIIEKIEVYEGGSSSRFGSGAIGGALNIITRNQFSNELKLNSSVGSFGLKQIEPVFSGSYKDVNLFASYNYIESDGDYNYKYIDNAGDNQSTKRLNSNFKSNNLFTKLNYQFNNSVITFNWQNFNSKRGIPGKVYGLSPYANSKNKNNIWGLSYFINGDEYNITADLKYSNNSTTNKNLYPQNTPLKYKKIPKYHYKYNVENYIVNVTNVFRINNWLKLISGYNLKKLNYNDENFRPSLKPPKTSANDLSQGVYFHQEWEKEFNWLKSQIVFTPAIRYDNLKLKSDDLSRTIDKWSPGSSLYLSVGEINKFYIKGNYSKSFRAPTFADLFYQDVRIEGKTDLQPEKGTNKDLSFGGNVKIWGILSAKYTIYENKIDDLIVWRLGSFEIFRPFNTDAELNGKEYSISYTLPKDILEISYSETDLDPINKGKGETVYNKKIPYRPLISKRAKVEFSYENFNAEFTYKYTGKRYVTEANTVEMPSYEVLDFNLSWKTNVNKVQIKFKLSLMNITKEKYEIIRDYPLPEQEWRFGISIIY